MMKRSSWLSVAAMLALALCAPEAFGLGFGGCGGFHADGFHGGGFDASGYRAGGFDASGARAGGFDAGGYRAVGFAGYGGAYFGLPTDAGFSAAWNAAAWPAVGTWCGWGNSVQPIIYQYGNNITYQGDHVYYGDQPVATADQYYQEAETLAQSVPQSEPQSTDWMPLGVFSLVQGEQADATVMFQLAINKSGVIAGNYYSVLAGSTLPAHGAVDKKPQRVAWTVGDNKTTVYDAGISSLTADEAPVLLHIGKDRTQQWMLVRLKQPEQANQ